MYICQICKKKSATIHLTDIHNNVKKEVHICETCAADKGFNLQGAANLPQLLGLAAKKSVPSMPPAAPPKPKLLEIDLVCPRCGTTWTQFNERGRLGCQHDYHAFGEKLKTLISTQIAPHVKNREFFHCGKKPGISREADAHEQSIRNLEKRIKQAVAEENYEAAAGFKAELNRLLAMHQIQA